MTERRLAQLRELVGTEASFLTSDPIHVRYLTGLSSSNAIILCTPETTVLFTDSRYALAAKQLNVDVQVSLGNDLFALVASTVATDKLIIEANRLSVTSLNRLQALLPNVSFETNHRLVEQIRVVKDETEIATIEAACNIATESLSAIIEQVQIGMTEQTIARLLHQTLLAKGADDIAFDTIVASGPNSAIPHHKPTQREIAQSDFLKIDFGAKLDGYHSDCTRTFVIGRSQSWHKEVFEAVLTAQRCGREALGPQVLTDSVTRSVQDSLTHANYAEFFTHGLGHGVGLEIHEDPFLTNNDAGRLKQGTVVTVEPGVYLEGRGGVRIEDTVVITQSGHRNLTNFSYDLIEIG